MTLPELTEIIKTRGIVITDGGARWAELAPEIERVWPELRWLSKRGPTKYMPWLESVVIQNDITQSLLQNCREGVKSGSCNFHFLTTSELLTIIKGTPMTKPELTPEQMALLPESTPLEVMKAIVDNGGPLWAVVWDTMERMIEEISGADIDPRRFLTLRSNYRHAALIPAVLPETTRAMTGDAWDMGLWILTKGGGIALSLSQIGIPREEINKTLTYSTSHRGPWYPPVMPVGRELSGAEWMEWSAKRGEG